MKEIDLILSKMGHKIDSLESEKKELLEALERVKSLEQLICLGGAVEEQWVSEALALDNMMTEIESLIQKQKQ